MKRAMLLIAMIVLLWTPAQAEDLFAEERYSGQASMRNALDGRAQALLSGIDPESNDIQKLFSLLHHTGQERQDAVKSSAVTLTRMAIVLILCGYAGSFAKTSRMTPIIVSMAGALGITAVVYGDLTGLMGICRQTTEEIQVFSKAMLPVMMTAMTISGAPSAGAVVCGAAVFALDLCISLITGLFIPAVSAYAAMMTVNAAVSNDMLTRLAAFVKWLITGSLKLLLTAFFTYITISGTASHGLDSSAVKAAKLALSGSVPVVGGILSGAADTVLSGAVLLKNALGMFGMLCLASICLIPFIRIGISYLLFRGGTALLSPICPPELHKLLDGIVDSIGMIFGMLGSCSAILFFELVYVVVMTA